MENCIFCKIASGQIPKKFRYQDENIVAFDDINPQASTHVVFIPRDHIENFEMLTDDSILASVRRGMQEVVKEKKLVGRGYKVLVNGGGAQVVEHLHFHLIGPIGLKI